ncbi:MAG: molybdopterin molybdotransferase MoeA [Microthrixaceae bacterium]
MALVPYEDAFARVSARLSVTDAAEVPIQDCVGLVTAEDIRSLDDVPPFDNTAVDGFAVRSVDVTTVPVELAVVATIAAGAAPVVTLEEGTCARIMTGALIPDGADAVVMVEDTEQVRQDGLDGGAVEGGTVRIGRPARGGAHIRPAGDDLRVGDLAIPASTRLQPAHVGLLATLGLTEVRVHRPPRVGVMSTGDELVGAGVPLAPGQIRDSNRQMLLTLCSRVGVDAIDLGLVQDDRDAIRNALESAAADCDAVVTSGGVSMGDYDYVKAVLNEIGDMDWMQVAIKPAKPFAFGMIGSTAVFGLPGNPVSSLVSFELFARRGLRQMMGYPEPAPRRLRAQAAVDFKRHSDGKVHYVRVGLVTADAALMAAPTGSQGSHQLAASAGADALAVIPNGDGIGAGEPVDVIPLA